MYTPRKTKEIKTMNNIICDLKNVIIMNFKISFD